MVSLLVNDRQIASQLIAERKAQGFDRYDEVWKGVYVLFPVLDNEHQLLVTEMSIAIGTAIDWNDLGQIMAGANVSDRRQDWTENYRVPDVLVFKPDTKAENCGTHWFGGPELAIEIVSPGDRTLEKLGFYAAVGTRELLVVDRHPWQLTLYRINAEHKLVPAAISRFDQPAPFHCNEFPLMFCLNSKTSSLDVSHSDGNLIRAIPISV